MVTLDITLDIFLLGVGGSGGGTSKVTPRSLVGPVRWVAMFPVETDEKKQPVAVESGGGGGQGGEIYSRPCEDCNLCSSSMYNCLCGDGAGI